LIKDISKVRVTVLLEADVHLELKIQAAKQGKTMNSIMSDAIEMYLQPTVDTLN
tara:strand:+ start:1372 stop:1533 length:162 start_codon:yes stop_codon:yes gene_type:complete